MKKNGLTEKETKTYAFGVTALLFLLLLTTAFYWNKSTNLNTENSTLKIKQDSLLVVKNRLDRDLAELANQLEESNTQKSFLEKNIEQMGITLAQKENAISQYKKQVKQINALNKQIKSLQTTRNQLQEELSRINNANQGLINENNLLKQQISKITKENELLKSQTNTTESNNIKPLLSASSFRVEVLKRNNKLTVKSRRSRQIEISFDIPEEMDIKGLKTVFVCIKNQNLVAIKDEDNKEFEIKLKTGKIIKSTAQMTEEVDFNSPPKRVTIKYNVEDKLKAGYYFIDLYTEESYIGSIQFRLI